MRKRSLLLLLSLVLVTIPFSSLRAQQQNTTTITVAVPDFQKEMYREEILKAFEDAHPGVKVRVVSGVQSITPAANNSDKHLDELKKYAAMGDLVYVDSDILSPEATNAGYFLDLNPVIRSDKNINESDFHASAWKAFQWDNGFWALPSGISPLVLTYDAEAFDRAGVAYPTDKWTLSDLLDAAQKLTVKDSSGKVTTPGIEIFPGLSGRALLAALLNGNLIDTTVSPNAPHLLTPEAEALLTAWGDLDAKGMIGNEIGKSPLSVGPSFTVSISLDPGNPTKKSRQAVLLPGGKAGVDVQGYALSAGTKYASLAYELALYLTTQKQLSGVFGGIPARLKTVETPINPEGGGGMITFGGPPETPEIKELNEKAVANGIGLADMRYTDYLVVAFQKIKSDKIDAHSALAKLETLAVANQKKALAEKDKTVIVVATPPPVQAGKITLNFGLMSFMRPIPFQEEWNKLLAEFAASDPAVGLVNLQTDFGDLAQYATKNDCFYLPYNAVPGANLKNILNFDPYLSVDSTFDASDVVGNILSQLQRDGKTWGFPINLDPTMLKYNTELFKNAGVPLPASGTWTIESFVDALKQLKSSTTGAPFEPNGPGGSHLLMLMAAYGGIPIDYRTDPMTVDLTSPASVEAIRQVLDLAKNGYMKYSALGNVMMAIAIGSAPTAPITSDTGPGFRMIRGNPEKDPYQSVLYPKGTKYTPMSYGVGTAYISAKSQNPDACYRLINLIARHPELFSTMPARRSIINAPTTATLLGKESVALYNEVDKLLKDSNTIAFPSMFQGGQSQAGFLIEHWVFQAFDNYVLKGANLETELKQADQYIKGFQECVAGLPAFDASSATNAMEYQKQYLNCAVKVDPSLKDFAAGPAAR